MGLMSEFKIPEEWRNEFIKTYIPLIADVDSVGAGEIIGQLFKILKLIIIPINKPYQC